jgi:dTDP-4-dehydrorhamnose 3,5-epimerase-like enzyme/dTDP-4-dehydrorhamnose reductase
MFLDQRGTLHSLKDLPFYPKEILVSVNAKTVLRGLHKSPYAKLIYVVRGTIHDFFLTEKGPVQVTLGPGESVYVPAGSPHGFYSVEDSEIMYLLDGKFDPALDRNIYWATPEFNFDFKFDTSKIIISDKDRDAPYAEQYDYLVLGASGFLGQNCVKTLREQGKKVLESNERLEFPSKISDQIKKSGARYVICAAGISGRPTIEWSETHEEETYKTNYLGVLNLMDACRDVHLTILGSGMVYTGQKSMYTEEDAPDLTTKVYCKWRVALEKVLRPNVLYLRIIYPCTFDGHPKCFYQKMRGRRESVHDVAVPLTIVPSLFPKLPELIESGETGTFNFVNEGTISLKNLIRAERVVPGSGGYGLSTVKLATKIEVPNVEKACTELIVSEP